MVLDLDYSFKGTTTNSEWFFQAVPLPSAAAGSEERSTSRLKKKKAVGLFRWPFMLLNQNSALMDPFIFWMLYTHFYSFRFVFLSDYGNCFIVF